MDSTANDSSHNLDLALAAALAQLAQAAPELAAAIQPVLTANLKRGRVEKFIGTTVADCAAYVSLVADHYQALAGYLYDLQVVRSPSVWEPLYIQLWQWARRFWQRRWPADAALTDLVAESVQLGAEQLLQAHFPYDTDFDPWAFTLLHNVCCQLAARQGRRQAWEQLLDVATDEGALAAQNPFPAVSGALDLRQAIARLAPSQQSVINLFYFEEQQMDDIARQLDVSLSTAYRYHISALNQLKYHLRQGEVPS